MKQIDVTPADLELVAAAAAAVKKPVAQPDGVRAPALVGAALRLDDGQIVTAVNIIADVGSLSMCAEPLAIAAASRQPDRKIDIIVAVYCEPGKEPKVVPPCGRCREFLADYAAKGQVILRDAGSTSLYKASVADLLPLRYGDYWKEGVLS